MAQTYMETVGETPAFKTNIFSTFWKGFERFFLAVGYSRAAAELSRQGYFAVGKKLMMKLMELTEIREDFKK